MIFRTSILLTAALSLSLGACIDSSDGDFDGDPMINPLGSGGGMGGSGDRDGDGWSDGDETAAGTNPNYAPSHPYTAPYNVGYCEQGEPKATGPSGTDSYGYATYLPGDVAENFEMIDRNGETVELYSFCGQTIMLVSSAFW